MFRILRLIAGDSGALGRIKPSTDDVADIARAAEAAEALGRLDVGQGAVSIGGRIVALEGVEGTDRMLGGSRSCAPKGASR